MSEDPGFPLPTPPADPGPLPADYGADTANVEAAPEPVEPAVTESATADAPDPVDPPFVPSEGVADWLRDAINGLHDRLRNVEK